MFNLPPPIASYFPLFSICLKQNPKQVHGLSLADKSSSVFRPTGSPTRLTLSLFPSFPLGHLFYKSEVVFFFFFFLIISEVIFDIQLILLYLINWYLDIEVWIDSGSVFWQEYLLWGAGIPTRRQKDGVNKSVCICYGKEAHEQGKGKEWGKAWPERLWTVKKETEKHKSNRRSYS